MSFIKYTIRRNRNKLKMIGWGALGIVLIFCILTVQLCATEGQSSAPPVPHQMVEQAPSYSPMTATGLPPTTMETLKGLANNTSGNIIVIMDPAALQTTPASQLPLLAPQNQSFNQPTETVYDQSQLIPDAATSLDSEFTEQSVICNDDFSQSQPQSIPRSNYFGLDPNGGCDEWEGFCDCDQKMFTRRGEVCGPECRLGKRLKRNPRESECSGF